MPLRPFDAASRPTTLPALLLQDKPYHPVVHGSPGPLLLPIQPFLAVQADPAVPSYSATSADTAGQGVGPTKVSVVISHVATWLDSAATSVGMSPQRLLLYSLKLCVMPVNPPSWVGTDPVID